MNEYLVQIIDDEDDRGKFHLYRVKANSELEAKREAYQQYAGWDQDSLDEAYPSNTFIDEMSDNGIEFYLLPVSNTV